MTKVKQWMTMNPITMEEDASVIEAIHIMKEKNVRRIPIMRKGKFVGLVTERMIKEYTPSKATALDTWEIHYLLSKTPVKEAMNPKPFTVTPDTKLTDAAQLIHDKKLNGLCVLDNEGNLAGILTTTNILEALIAICKNPQDFQQ
ncbi:MAG: CBS domain-containing protein [Desulfuromonadaceae bacterium]